MKNFVMTGDNLSFLASDIVAPQHVAGDIYTNLVGPGSGLVTPINLVESGDPCIIGGKGIEKIVELSLTEEEKAMLKKSAASVQAVVDVVKKG